MVWLHCYELARVVLPDGHLAGGGAVPAANLQHGVGGLDGSPDRLVGEVLDVAVRGVEVLREEVALLVRRDRSRWEL